GTLPIYPLFEPDLETLPSPPLAVLPNSPPRPGGFLLPDGGTSSVIFGGGGVFLLEGGGGGVLPLITFTDIKSVIPTGSLVCFCFVCGTSMGTRICLVGGPPGFGLGIKTGAVPCRCFCFVCVGFGFDLLIFTNTWSVDCVCFCFGLNIGFDVCNVFRYSSVFICA